MLFDVEGRFWVSLRYFMIESYKIPWYIYILLLILLIFIAIYIRWWVAPAFMGLLVLVDLSAGIVTAFSDQKIAKLGGAIGISDKGIEYLISESEPYEEGLYTAYSVDDTLVPWYEVEEIHVFKTFIVIKCLRISKQDTFFIPTEDISDIDYYVEQILAFWKQAAYVNPSGHYDKRLLLIFIAIVMLGVEFLYRYLFR